MSVSVPSPGCATAVLTKVATLTIGTTWVLDRERLKIFAPEVDVEALQAFLLYV